LKKLKAEYDNKLKAVSSVAKAPFVFTTVYGSQLLRYWPSEQFHDLREEMGLPKDCVIHSTRHTFCTRLGEAGASAFVIQRLAGHSDIKISARYVHPTENQLELAVQRMGDIRVQAQTNA
jgi:site-specific recombinase XerD